jgi:hypothetical protein
MDDRTTFVVIITTIVPVSVPALRATIVAVVDIVIVTVFTIERVSVPPAVVIVEDVTT